MSKKNKLDIKNYGIKLKDILRIFLKRKWLFIGFFLVVLIAGLLFTFLKPPIFKTDSMLKLTEIYYDDSLYSYFPVEAKILGIYSPEADVNRLEEERIVEIAKELESDDVLNKLSKNIDLEINKEDLNAAANVYIDRGNRSLKIDVTYDTAEGAYQICEGLTYLYLDIKEKEFIDTYDSLMAKIDDRISELQVDIRDIDNENYDSLSEKNSEIDSINMIIINLEEIKYNLEQNKDVYLEKFEITQEPAFPGKPINEIGIKDILIIVFVAIAVGLIAVFIPNIFIPTKV